MRKGIPLADWPDADLPDAAAILLATRAINRFAGTAYSLEEVAAMDPIVFELIAALQRGINPQ